MMPGTDLILKLSSVALAHEHDYSAFSTFVEDTVLKPTVCWNYLSVINL